MEANFFSELKKYFEKLPGIGPRQAARFIWSLVDFSADERKKFSNLILNLDQHLKKCDVCFRIFTKRNATDEISTACSFCSHSSHRDQSKIMVLERDSNLLNIEKTGVYKGVYFILGGVVDPLDENPVVRDRIKKLYERFKGADASATKEIILALSPTKMGEFTANYIGKVLEPLFAKTSSKLKITRLARGLSTGVDLEYADEMTLKNALDNRK